MVMHARSGGSIEVMGLMQGYIAGDSFIVTDALRLPVEGTETRVNAQDEANEYMVQFLTSARETSQTENAVGWYHSHPGYGCWLSGIDVNTQMTQQTFSDPFCAVVIDPDQTISAGKVEIGAFRTFPENYTPATRPDAGSGDSSIPLAKAEDFGAHAARYYSMEVSHFKSSLDTKLLDALWNKYWVGTLSSSPLFTNRDYGTKQMVELALKIKRANGAAKMKSKGGQGPHGMLFTGGGGKGEEEKNEGMDRIVKAGDKIAAEEEAGLLAAEIKERLFTGVVAKSTVA